MIHGSRQRSLVTRSSIDRYQQNDLPTSRPTFGWLTITSIGLIAAANILAVSGFRLPFLGPAVGFWFLIVQPVYLLYMTRLWRGSSSTERVGYSIAGVLLLLMIAGLAASTLLPFLRVQRPLEPITVVVVGDILTVSLYLLRRRNPARLAWRNEIKVIGQKETRLIVCSGFCVGLAVIGANRLNNNAGDTVSLVALVLMTAALISLLRWHAEIRDGIAAFSLYMVSLALLLMTSLRGWYVTGHDIQTEYQVFQLTEAHARWSMSYFHDAYNACLSITILPTELSQVVHVDNPYIYKVFFQLLFALCPALVYTIARRYWSRPISVVAAIYFIGLPTFATDMPFINRQEIAFLFVCAAILAITNINWSRRQRQATFFASALGVELSHYSSMYFFIGILLVAWVAQIVGRLSPRRLRRTAYVSDAGTRFRGAKVQTIGIGSIVVLISFASAWGQLVTHTAGSALTDAESAITGLVNSNGTRSGDLGKFFFSGKTLSLQAILKDYNRTAFEQRAASAPATYVPTSVVAHYPTPIANGLPPLPLTTAGRLLSYIGISAAEVNSVIRNAAAKDEQLFAIVGFIVFVATRRLRQYVGREVFCIGIGSIVMVGIMIVLPNLSVDYGILRAFEEALIVIAPVLVAGSLTIFSPFGRVWALRLSAAVCLGIFISTTGLLPQILGGYPAQLSLNNSGLYYDIYYTHPQEMAAVDWLGSEPDVLRDGVQASFAANRFAFTAQSKVTGSQSVTDIFPPLVRRASWDIAGYSILHVGRSTALFDGDLVTYAYPLGFLKDGKNLVYDNGGAEIYK
jgi:uncharacterized membrane protein